MDGETKTLLRIIQKSEKLLRELRTLKCFSEEVKTLESLKFKLEKSLVDRIGKRIENHFEVRE